MEKNMSPNKTYDTIILGAGLAGSTLASILARQNTSVLVIEKGSTPCFTTGEAMLPTTAFWCWLLGKRYDVTEILHLAHPDEIHTAISTRSGLNRTIGFLYHRAGHEQNPQESQQFILPTPPFIQGSHLFREDVDEYLLKTAIRYGADYRDQTTVSEIEIDGAGVRVFTSEGEIFYGRYLVDGTGSTSLVARKYGLREKPTWLKTHSRSIFTHMEGVQPYGEAVSNLGHPNQSASWHEGTLHHVFNGGWMWIMPFGNHKGSTNNLASVGLQLNTNKHPRRDSITPKDEFFAIMASYPSIARQLETGIAVQPFIGTDRIQYSSRTSLGPRYFLLNQAYGSVDPLYSLELISSFETIYAFAHRLIEALREDDFSAHRFVYLERLQRAQLKAADQMVHNAYRSMVDFSLFHAWTHVWLARTLLTEVWMLRNCIKYIHTGDRSIFAGMEGFKRPGEEAPFAEGLQTLVNRVSIVLDRMEEGRGRADHAAASIFVLLSQAAFLPHKIYSWGDSDQLHLEITPSYKIVRLILWGKTTAPERLRG